ncbi:polygalacturonase inhibitor [Solanum lycopersicum]|uniref:polygalacturonase inhibitor n=1 Tax=Solanum lycopersicum TaxID=4081 RepID=UPI003748AC51
MKPSSIVSILSFSLFFLSQISPSLSAERCHPNDKKALLEFKKALGNPDDLGNWNPKTDCCIDWYGPTLECDEKSNRINLIDFSKMNLSGYLSPAIGDLTYLTKFSIHNVRNLTGPIPSTIVKLTNLIFFRISESDISGPVPEVLSRLKSLTYINLSYNKLVGTIPASLSQLPYLEFLRLDRNKLTGPIPESFGKLAPNLTYLYLGHNQLTGIVPTSFAGWSFDTIDLSRNMLEGDISFLFGKDKTTYEMLLDRNKFEFDMSKLTFGKGLWRLELSHNKIYGSIPKIISKNPWQILNVSYNRLCGKIPKGENMQKFEIYEYFHNKCLCGAPLRPCK